MTRSLPQAQVMPQLSANNNPESTPGSIYCAVHFKAVKWKFKSLFFSLVETCSLLLDCVGAFFEWNFPEIQVKFYLTREVSNNDRGKTVLCWEFSTKGKISFYTKHFDFYFIWLYISHEHCLPFYFYQLQTRRNIKTPNEILLTFMVLF